MEKQKREKEMRAGTRIQQLSEYHFEAQQNYHARTMHV